MKKNSIASTLLKEGAVTVEKVENSKYDAYYVVTVDVDEIERRRVPEWTRSEETAKELCAIRSDSVFRGSIFDLAEAVGTSAEHVEGVLRAVVKPCAPSSFFKKHFRIDRATGAHAMTLAGCAFLEGMLYGLDSVLGGKVAGNANDWLKESGRRLARLLTSGDPSESRACAGMYHACTRNLSRWVDLDGLDASFSAPRF